MPDPLVTLTTDYGDSSPYAAVLKGVILSLNPAARVVDLSHRVRPQDVRHGSYLLGTAAPYFPPGTIHIAVVDPGVGTSRAGLCVEVGGHILVGPDNGLFTHAIRALGGTPCVRHLVDPRFWRPDVSATFHGRDVFGPVAAHLTLGCDPADLGPAVAEWVELPHRSAVVWQNRVEGEVEFVDDFGNLVTNIPADRVKSLPPTAAIGAAAPAPLPWVRAYADAAAGELVCVFSSDGFFEVAVVNGSAAARLGATVGTPVRLEFE